MSLPELLLPCRVYMWPSSEWPCIALALITRWASVGCADGVLPALILSCLARAPSCSTAKCARNSVSFWLEQHDCFVPLRVVATPAGVHGAPWLRRSCRCWSFFHCLRGKVSQQKRKDLSVLLITEVSRYQQTFVIWSVFHVGCIAISEWVFCLQM